MKDTVFKADVPDEYLKFGAYFKSDNDITSQYLIEICDGKFNGNVLVKIFTTSILENYFKTDGLNNGSIIGVPEYDIDWVADVDLHGKYFFPVFNNERQLYYDEKKYYGGDYKSNSITSLFEAINFAIDYGLSKSGIIPY